MRFVGIGIALCAWLLFAHHAFAQFQSPSESLNLHATRVSTWSQGRSSVVQLEGNVVIETDRAKLTAQSAVVWLTRVEGALLDEQRVEISLIGDANIEQPDVTRSGGQLYVSSTVRGPIRLVADQRSGRDLSDSPLFKSAAVIRSAQLAPASSDPHISAPHDWSPTALPTQTPSAQPATQPIHPIQPVTFVAKRAEMMHSSDGNLAVVLSGDVTLLQRRENDDLIELHADNVVIFTKIENLSDLEKSAKYKHIEDAVAAAYLEGDVRIVFTPGKFYQTEQRMRAKRVYYEFGTDRAILTDAVIHTSDPGKGIPVFVRAETIKQLSVGEFATTKAELSTSSFAVPSVAIAAQKAYVHQVSTGDPAVGSRTTFNASNATLNMWGVPIFYTPVAGGSMTDRSRPLRNIQVENSSNYGWSVLSQWGLFESLGKPAPPDLDITYRLDYYTDRGPAGGLDAKYGGGFVSDITGQPWNFDGNFKSYIINDHGVDSLGGSKPDIEPEQNVRGRVNWEHAHYFPNDWTAQIRAGYTSDPTFLPSWFRDEFNQAQEQELAMYLKHQRDTEAYSLLISVQPNNFVTSADQMQEQLQVERLPELAYHSIGKSFADDALTSFTDASVSGLRFEASQATLAEQGFPPTLNPGKPSIGTTGTPGDTTYRVDIRQEFDYPLNAGRFKVVPYIFERFTGYSDSPDGQSIGRFYTGGGARITTSFWNVNDAAKSELFDIHRVRHVIEPELNLYTSAQTADHDDLFIYDSQIDGINDVSAVQLALHQRWQTKRGGPGRWRNVDFFTLNVSGDFFANQPPAAERAPVQFRGLFFPTLPEASIPRNAINADATWRVSDSMAVLADMSENLDDTQLATAAVGVAVQRDERLSYYLGNRYIDALSSNIASASLNYKLSPKYDFSLAQSFDFGQRTNVAYGASLARHFDRFFFSFRLYYDQTNNVSGFTFAVFSNDVGHTVSADPVRTVFGSPQY